MFLIKNINTTEMSFNEGIIRQLKQYFRRVVNLKCIWIAQSSMKYIQTTPTLNGIAAN